MAKPQIDVNPYLGKDWSVIDVSYNRRDLVLYSLGIGCDDMKFIYEKDSKFAMFPTYPFLFSFKGTDQDTVDFPSNAMAKVKITPPLRGAKTGLDGERYLEVINPMPAGDHHTFKLKSRLMGVQGKKSGALMEIESIVVDESGKEYIRMVSGAFVVGAKDVVSAGKTNSENIKVPDRTPDAVEEQVTSVAQAHLYRLSGDYNPLHIDPRFAKMFGFKQPILHGLCSLGFAANAVIKHYCGGDPALFRAIKLRFASPVLPGQTLVTSMWKDGDRVILESKVKETGKVVINNAYVQLNAPKAKL